MEINVSNSEVKINLFILYHLLGHVIFVSHYIDDDVIARICCDMYHVKCREKSGHVTYMCDVYYLAMSHLYQIALMISSSEHVNMVLGAKIKKREIREDGNTLRKRSN